MARYIDADKLIEKAEKMNYSAISIPMLKSEPTADVRPNVRGEWKDGWRSGWDGVRHWYRYCNQCGYERDDDDPVHDSYFCPNCGADMRGEQDE